CHRVARLGTIEGQRRDRAVGSELGVRHNLMTDYPITQLPNYPITQLLDYQMSDSALQGLRVLDVTQVMAGPYCAMMLADLGATVIKVEPPGGDSTRQMPGASGSDSPSFNAVNRGKRSIVLNLKTAEARDVFTRLAQSSDIVIENYRPGVMTSLGLDYRALSAANPRLIYASISGYGQTGPHRGKGGFDLIAQGVSGIMSVTGE